MDILHISIANLKRKPARTLAIFLGLCALTSMLVSLSIINLSVNNALKVGGSRLGADAMVVPSDWQEETMGALLSGGPTEFYMKSEVEEQVRALPEVEATASQLFVISAPLSCCTVSDTMLIGIDPVRDFTVSPWLRNRLGREISEDEVIVGSNILAEPQGRMKFYGREFIIAGKLEPTGMKYIDSSVFIPISGVRDMIAHSSERALKTLSVGEDDISALLLQLNGGTNPEETALRIENAVSGVKVVLSSQVLRAARKNLALPLKVMAFAIAIQWAVSLILIGVLYSMSIAEREREVGILRAAGARPSDVFRLFAYEVLMISGAGGLAGILIGLLFVTSFKGLIRLSFNVPFLMPNTGVLVVVSALVLSLVLLTSVMATLRPILRISRKSPFSAMQTGS